MFALLDDGLHALLGHSQGQARLDRPIRAKINCQGLGTLAGQGLFELVKAVKLLPAPMHANVVPVPGQGCQSRVPVKILVGQHKGPVHRGSLKLVDRGGVAVGQVRILLNVKSALAAVVQTDLQHLPANAFNCAQIAVSNVQYSVVFQKHDPISLHQGQIPFSGL
jgi:hypothetical protein